MEEIKPIFTYYLSNNAIESFACHYEFGDIVINADARTPVDCAASEKLRIAVIGIAIDTSSGTSEKMASFLLARCNCVDDIIRTEYALGGKYVIVVDEHGTKYVLGDATCSISICYYLNSGMMNCASDPFIIARINRISEDECLKKIRNSGDLSQAMPYDVTVFKDIKQLLPNHIMNLNSGEIKRYTYFEQEIQSVSPADAARQIVPLLSSMVRGFRRYFDLVVPITSGRDSRVVLAAVYGMDRTVKTYTLKHKKHKDNDDDLVLSKALTDHLGITHVQYDDIEIPKHLIDYCNSVFGENRYSSKTLEIAATVKEYFDGYAIVNGDIMGQIGKCSLHRNIPIGLASPGYFRCKMHNFSKEAKTLTKEWMRDVRASKEKMLIFDLFSIENRMGRWAAQNISIYNYIGQPNINIFNSRSIIGILSCVDRKQRMVSRVHVEILRLLDKRFLDIPFEREKSRAIRISKRNAAFFYLAGFFKYYRDKKDFYHLNQNR